MKRARLICGVLLTALTLAGCGENSHLSSPPPLVFSTATGGAASAIPSGPAAGTLLVTYRGHVQAVRALAWSSDNAYILSGSLDGTAQVWYAATGQMLWSYGVQHHQGQGGIPIDGVAWSPDGTIAAVTTLDAQGAPIVLPLTPGTGKPGRGCGGPRSLLLALAWAPDGERIAAVDAAGTAWVWDVTSCKVLMKYTAQGSLNALAWSPGRTRLAVGGNDHLVHVLDVASGQEVIRYTGHSQAVQSLAWAPDGIRIASGSADTTVQVWDASTGQHDLTYHGQVGNVDALAWSPDSTRIVSASSSGSDGAPVSDTIQIWNALSGERVFNYQGQSGNILALAWSPDGTRIASASSDATVQVWQAT
jgi:WD40 repeat protein